MSEIIKPENGVVSEDTCISCIGIFYIIILFIFFFTLFLIK